MCKESTISQKVLGKRLNKSQGVSVKNKTGITTTICKCTKCGLIYSNPQPIPESLQDHYGVPPEDYWVEDYFKISDDYFKHEIEVFKKLYKYTPGLFYLDIGAGIGKQMVALDKQGFNVYGFEPSKPFYDRAITRMGIKPERLKLAMIEDVEYDENSFDFISFGAVLEHLYHPNEAIRKALKWAKPGGLIHIEVPSSEWLINNLINLVYRVKGTDYVANISPMHTPYHLYEFSLESFKLNAKENNYEIASHEYFVCETYFPKAFDFILKKYMKKTNTGMQLSIWLRKN